MYGLSLSDPMQSDFGFWMDRMNVWNDGGMMERERESRLEILNRRRIEGWKEGIRDRDKDGMIKRGEKE